MPFPAVDGGAGSIDEYPSNVGLPATFNAKTYAADNNVGAWLKCIAANYGNEALKQGRSPASWPMTPSIELPAISQTIKETIDASTDSVLWFEALFNAKASSDLLDERGTAGHRPDDARRVHDRGPDRARPGLILHAPGAARTQLRRGVILLSRAHRSRSRKGATMKYVLGDRRRSRSC